MLLVLLLAAAGLLLAPQAAASGALQALRACAARVIPTLLPFFVVSRMLTALPLPTPGRRADRLFRALFGVRAACLPALLTGLLGGYPAGAAAVTELLAVLAEGYAYKRRAAKIARPMLFSLCMNALSFGTGLVIKLIF